MLCPFSSKTSTSSSRSSAAQWSTSQGGLPNRAARIFQGGDLHHAIEKVRWLIKFMTLRELGFDDEALKKLALRNQNFTFLRSK